MSIVVHYARCWECQFAESKADHPKGLHTWMDRKDREHAGIPKPTTDEDRKALAESHPCSCWCVGRSPVVRLW